MTRPTPPSYLLRLWREHASAPLRATLIAVSQPDTQQHFATLEALFAFLRAQAHDQQGHADSLYCTADRQQTEATNNTA